jgi:hypothetical protein
MPIIRWTDDYRGPQGRPKNEIYALGLWVFLLKHGLNKFLRNCPKFEPDPRERDNIKIRYEDEFDPNGNRLADPYDLEALACLSLDIEEFEPELSAILFQKHFSQHPDWTLLFMQETRRIYAGRMKHVVDYVLLTDAGIKGGLMDDSGIQLMIEKMLTIKNFPLNSIKTSRLRLHRWLEENIYRINIK